LERDAVPEYVAAFDVALQPAVVPYASPLKLFEYLAQGAAIVAPDQANIREILTHEVDAILFDPEESGALSDAIERVCSNDRLRARLGSAALRVIETKGLTWDRNAERVVELFRRLGVGGS
jgi:glycosyltransferase involved in cell wall biosynthesis